MKSFFIGLLLGLSCLSVFAQDQNYFQQRESMIILRNPLLSALGRFDDTPEEWSLGIGSQFEYGYFVKDRILIGGGILLHHSTSFSARPVNNVLRAWGFQLFGRYYFPGWERGRHNLSLYVEPRLKVSSHSMRSFTTNDIFVNEGQSLSAHMGIFLSWRFAQRWSIDTGLQASVGWSQLFSPLTPDPLGPIYNLQSSSSINFHL